MDVNTVFSGDTLKAADLQGREIPVIISKIEMKKFDSGNKLLLHFDGKKKTLVANKTNSKRIASMYGPNTDLWIGNQITLYVDQVDFQGNLVDAIRVKVIKQQPPKTVPQATAKMNGDLDDKIPF